MSDTLERINSRIVEAEKWISNLEDRMRPGRQNHFLKTEHRKKNEKQ